MTDEADVILTGLQEARVELLAASARLSEIPIDVASVNHTEALADPLSTLTRMKDLAIMVSDDQLELPGIPEA